MCNTLVKQRMGSAVKDAYVEFFSRAAADDKGQRGIRAVATTDWFHLSTRTVSVRRSSGFGLTTLGLVTPLMERAVGATAHIQPISKGRILNFLPGLPNRQVQIAAAPAMHVLGVNGEGGNEPPHGQHVKKMLRSMSGLESRPATKAPETQKQMGPDE